jgi:hypothetical protein
MTVPLASLDRRTWLYVAIGVAVVSGVLTGVLVGLLAGVQYGVSSGAVAGVLVLLGVLAIGILHLKLSSVEHAVARNVEELKALVNIRPLIGTIPISWGRWAIDAMLAQTLAGVLRERHPEIVLECGSGSSTVFIAACLRALGHGKLITLDHDRAYAERTQSLLAEQGLAEWATVLIAPLVERRITGKTYRWYDFEPEAVLPKHSVGVMFVDGPPAWTPDGHVIEMARFPAVPVLRDYLAADWIIVMDDSNRSDERSIGQHWSELLGAKLVYEPGVKGIQILRPAATSDAVQSPFPCPVTHGR